jgi:sortase A
MNKRNGSLKRFLAGFGIVIGLMITSGATIYIGGLPIINMTIGNWNMMISKGAPSYTNEYDKNVYLLINEKSGKEASEIQVPSVGVHYGNITCDRIDLGAPIYYGDSETILLKGVGHYTASGLPGEGKPILIGGHDISYFAPLKEIETSDIVIIDTNYGQFEYKVLSTRITDPQDTTAYDLSLQEEQLILYTCYPFGQLIGERERYFIYCEPLDDSSDNP